MRANSSRCNTEEDLHLKRPCGYVVFRNTSIYERQKDTNLNITAYTNIYTYKYIHNTVTSLNIGVYLTVLAICALNDLTQTCR
jgi:hypothetical protein